MARDQPLGADRPGKTIYCGGASLDGVGLVAPISTTEETERKPLVPRTVDGVVDELTRPLDENERVGAETVSQ